MSAAEPLSHLIGINSCELSKEENILLEAELFTLICGELREIFREQYKDYFRLMKFTVKKENIMLETKFVRLIIQDILSTKEYNLKGIACYANTHEDVVQELVSGLNISPSVALFRRIIELHRSVRRDLYQMLVKKITEKLVTTV